MEKASQQQSPLLVPNPKAGSLDRVREVMRFPHSSLRNEKAYWQRMRRDLDVRHAA